MDPCAAWWLPENYIEHDGIVTGTFSDQSQVQTFYILAWVRTMACSRNQHIAGGRGGVPIFIIMSISYDQTVSKVSAYVYIHFIFLHLFLEQTDMKLAVPYLCLSG